MKLLRSDSKSALLFEFSLRTFLFKAKLLINKHTQPKHTFQTDEKDNWQVKKLYQGREVRDLICFCDVTIKVFYHRVSSAYHWRWKHWLISKTIFFEKVFTFLEEKLRHRWHWAWIYFISITPYIILFFIWQTF
jgi:hypothetical protein